MQQAICNFLLDYGSKIKRNLKGITCSMRLKWIEVSSVTGITCIHTLLLLDVIIRTKWVFCKNSTKWIKEQEKKYSHRLELEIFCIRSAWFSIPIPLTSPRKFFRPFLVLIMVDDQAKQTKRINGSSLFHNLVKILKVVKILRISCPQHDVSNCLTVFLTKFFGYSLLQVNSYWSCPEGRRVVRSSSSIEA